MTHGIAMHQEDVFGSSYSAAIYISRILRPAPPKNKVFVLGEAGIEAELEAEGISYIGGTDPAFGRDITASDHAAIASGDGLDAEVGLVLIGLDFHVNYLKLAHAYAYLRRGATFLATNTDSTLPMNGTFFPGAGAVGAPLVKAIGREPLSTGKPSQAMMDAIEGKFSIDRSRTCMVGDRLNTDIRFGLGAHLAGTLLVLTGVTTREDLFAAENDTKPSAFVDKLGDLFV